MIFNLQSTDPNNYGTIKFNSQIPLSEHDIKFRIISLNTIATFMITTDDDYIKFEINNEDSQSSAYAVDYKSPSSQSEILTFKFTNRTKYYSDELASDLKIIFPSDIDVELNDTGTLTLKSNISFSIVDASHRVRLLMGFYELISFPIHSNKVDTGFEIVLNSAPYLNFGNILYLTSSLSNVCAFNDNKNKQINMSVCYSINEFFAPGIPLISKAIGPNVNIRPLELSNLQFTLVDFQFYPIILKAPLRITIEFTQSDMTR